MRQYTKKELETMGYYKTVEGWFNPLLVGTGLEYQDPVDENDEDEKSQYWWMNY